ncbi:sporulation protein [Falsibacillus albus]|nr:sporulation protein [Falsibacillus albus]
MWKEFLSSIGIGNMKVDTIVRNPRLSRKDRIEGEIVIYGGNIVQKVDAILLSLLYRYEEIKEDSDFTQHEREIMEKSISDIGKIKPKETKRIPFEIALESDHPLTHGSSETVLRTILLIPNSINPQDEDTIVVVE